jgi:uncharacterized protein with gpF-like domain
MDEDRFWSLVEKVGWGTDDRDYKAKELVLMRELSPVEASQLQMTMDTCQGKLAKVLEGFKKELKARSEYKELSEEETAILKCWMGGDSWSDLIARIIGEGKEEFDKVLEDPKVGWVRAVNHEYAESFKYCLPYFHTYENLEVERYVDWAKRNVESLQEAIEEAKEDRLKDEVIEELEKLIEMHMPMAEGNYEEFLAQEEELRQLAEDSAFYKWGIWNLCSDARRYLIDFHQDD